MWVTSATVPSSIAWDGARNTVVPDGTINWYDAPMPQALVQFNIIDSSEAAALSELDKGDLEGALQCYREAERIARAVFGNDHPKVATCVNNVGCVLLDRGDVEGAIGLAKEAFDIRIRRLGPRALDTLQSARTLRAVGLDPIALAREAAGEDAARELAALLDADQTPFQRQ